MKCCQPDRNISCHRTLRSILLYSYRLGKAALVWSIDISLLILLFFQARQIAIMELFKDLPLPVPDPSKTKKNVKKTPQEVLSEFWDKFHTKVRNHNSEAHLHLSPMLTFLSTPAKSHQYFLAVYTAPSFHLLIQKVPDLHAMQLKVMKQLPKHVVSRWSE